MKGKTFLVVDDNDNYRENLLQSLRTEGALVDGARSGKEAIAKMEKSPQNYQFAVIDHVLDGDMDGIETTRALVNCNQNLFALVFTNVPTDNADDIARFKHEAFSAGAYRYLERGSVNEAPKQVKDFIREIEQLAFLRSWIQNYYENREQVPSLLTQLDVGVDIIDRSYKVWYMNNAMRRITGLQGQDFPKSACSMWHGFRFCPCPGCLVRKAFEECDSQSGMFLSPLINRDVDKLYFMNVWAQPIKDQKGNILFAVDGKPLAVMESVQDITDTNQLARMPLGDRLNLIATSLLKRPIENTYLGETHFESVEIGVRDKDRSFIRKGVAGGHLPMNINGPMDLYAEGYLLAAEEKMKKSNMGYFYSGAGRQERCVLWPILENDEPIAVIKANGSNHCNEDSVLAARPYAAEVYRALIDARKGKTELVINIGAEIAAVDSDLQAVSSPIEALRTLVLAACQLTESKLAVLRYRDKDDAILLRLGLGEYDAYERIAQARIPLSNTVAWSSQTIISGREFLPEKKEIIGRRAELPQDAQIVLQDADAICFMPLLLDGRCIGALGLYSNDETNFSDEKKLLIAQELSRRVALALYDYLVYQSAQKRVEEAQYETVGLLLHNINTPLANIRYTLDMLKEHIIKNPPTDEYRIRQLDDLLIQIDKISRIRLEFLRLIKDWVSRMEFIDIHERLRTKVAELIGKNKDVQIAFDLDESIKNIKVDSASLIACLEVLLQNSLDEFERKANNKQIKIRLRSVSAQEASSLSSTGLGIAIDIEDNGPGVPETMVNDLFRIIRSGKAKGLGFGLTFCRKVARTARGDVYYQNDFLEGAKFTIILPYESI